MQDRFTKSCLATIAAALIVIAVQGAIPDATAQGGGCGENISNPCWVKTDMREPIFVTSKPSEPVWVEIVP